MKNIWVIFIIACLSFCLSAQDYKQVRIYLTSPTQDIQLLGQNHFDLEHAIHTSKHELTLFMSDREFAKFTTLPFKYDILINSWNIYFRNRQAMSASEKQASLALSITKYGVSGFGYGSMAGFYIFDEIIAQLDSMRLKYPNLISAKKQIGTSIEGRPIYAVRISKTPDADGPAPQILYTAMHHAREPQGMMAVLYYMQYLLNNYSINPSVKYLVDNREMWFIPIVNPDGYEYNRSTNPDGGGMWRKNRRPNADSTYGIDLNRNYGPQQYWDSPNNGSSAITSDETYRGLSPFSEPETQTIRNFIRTKKFRIAINYHTYGDDVIFPYGALPHETADSVTYHEYGASLTLYNRYTAGRDTDVVGYSTRGNSDDFMYDGDGSSRGKILALTTEIGTGNDGFWPEQARILPLAQENLYPNLFLAWVSGEYINLEKSTCNKKYILPGDTISLTLTMRNRGLSTGKNLSVQVSSLSSFASIAGNSVSIDSIQARASFTIPKSFVFMVAKGAPVQSKINLLITSMVNQTVVSTDTLSMIIGQPIYAFIDSANDIRKYWTVTATPPTPKWDTTSATYFSAPSCYTDSKSGTYSTDATVSMTSTNPVSLVGLTNPHLSFKTKYELESSWDCGVVQISSDNGSSWISLAGLLTKPGSGQGRQLPAGSPIYDGTKTDWATEDIDLTPWAGKQIKLRFELRSDDYINKDGWYIDDIAVYSYSSVSGLANEPGIVPIQFELAQNYPNPFNPSTTINYSLPFTGTVRLVLYNALGQSVKELVHTVLPAGIQQVQFNAGSLPSGIYFYRIEVSSLDGTKNYHDVKKCILLK